MSLQDPERLQEQIMWDFTVVEQRFAARYGRFGGNYYKQHMPAGLPLPRRHPPKRVPKKLYNLAKRMTED